MKQAPNFMNGKKLAFDEVFRSPFEKETESEALRTLAAIREAHPAYYGWVEFEGYAEQLSNGKWRAVRHHAQYK